MATHRIVCVGYDPIRDLPVNTPEEVAIARQAIADAGDYLESIYEWASEEEYNRGVDSTRTGEFLTALGVR